MGRMGRMGRMGAEDDPAHAGGPSSTLLNDALNTTRDGTVGHWDGAARFTPKFPFSDTVDDILYLGEDIRGQLLNYALFSAMSITGTAASAGATGPTLGAATLHGTHPLLTVHQPRQDHFGAQLTHLRTYADLRADRMAEINVQLGDGLSFAGAIGYLDAQRRGRTLDLLEAVERVAVHLEMQVKHLCRSPRPVDYAPEVQPLIQTPDHSAFPSGHATESFAVATVLHRLMTGDSSFVGLGRDADDPAKRDAPAHPFRLAERMAVNRTVAGVHFPCDSAAGALLGCAIGEQIHALGSGQTLTALSMDFLAGDGPDAGFADTDDFTLEWLADRVVAPTLEAAPEEVSVIRTAWALAAAEWPKPAAPG